MTENSLPRDVVLLVVLLLAQGLLPGNVQAQSAGAPASATDQTLSGLDDSEAAMIRNQGVLPETHDIVRRMAWQTRKLGPDAIGIDQGVDLNSLPVPANQPGFDESKWISFQFHPATVSGTLVEAIPWTDLDPDAERTFWRVRLKTTSGLEISGVVTDVAVQWRELAMPIEDVRLTGILIGPTKSNDSDTRVTWMMAANRAGWFPATVNEPVAISPGLVTLARSGFDVGRIEEIRKSGMGPLTRFESTAFAAFAKAVAGVGDESWTTLKQSGSVGGVLDIFNQARTAMGMPIQVQGIVRRITRTGRGFDQIELFVETGGRPLAITNPAGEKLIFRSRFPLTVNLPAGIIESSVEEGSSAEIEGFVYRFWSYQTQFSEEQGAGYGQTLPLIIGRTIRRTEGSTGQLDIAMTGLIGGLVGLCGLTGGAVWLMNRRDRIRRQLTSSARYQPPNGSQTP